MYVSWDVESYLSSRTVWEEEWYRLDIVGTEFSLFSARLRVVFGDTYEPLTEHYCVGVPQRKIW